MIRNHLRSNIIGYLALFFALTGTAVATHPGGANTISSADIINAEVKTVDIGTAEVQTADIANSGVETIDIADDAVTHAKIIAGGVRTSEISNNNVQSIDILDETIVSADIATDGVGSSEIAADNVGSSEIAPGVVGSDELDTVHEHFGPATDIVDATAHDGAYATSTSTVSCGVGEDLLSVSIDWIDIAGHFEVMTSGVESITRGEPDAATVRAAFDGGAGPATYQAVATCIF